VKGSDFVLRATKEISFSYAKPYEKRHLINSNAPFTRNLTIGVGGMGMLAFGQRLRRQTSR